MNKKIITIEDVNKAGRLSNLRIEEEEIDYFTDQLNNILDYFGKIQQLSLDNIPPTPYVVDLACPTRKDVVEVYENTEPLVESAPEKEANMVKVPKIIEE